MFPVLLNLFSIVFVNVVLKEVILLYYITEVLSQKSFTAIMSESITLLSTLFWTKLIVVFVQSYFLLYTLPD